MNKKEKKIKKRDGKIIYLIGLGLVVKVLYVRLLWCNFR